MSEYNPNDMSKSSKPIKTYDETEVLKSSNTWEFLIFKNLDNLRMLNNTLFLDPPHTKHNLITLVIAMNHLESMLKDKIDPNYKQNTPEYIEFQKLKPNLFKNLDRLAVSQEINDLANGGIVSQMQLAAKLELWFQAFDRALNNIKRINPTVFTMMQPVYDTSQEKVETPFSEE